MNDFDFIQLLVLPAVNAWLGIEIVNGKFHYASSHQEIPSGFIAPNDVEENQTDARFAALNINARKFDLLTVNQRRPAFCEIGPMMLISEHDVTPEIKLGETLITTTTEALATTTTTEPSITTTTEALTSSTEPSIATTTEALVATSTEPSAKTITESQITTTTDPSITTPTEPSITNPTESPTNTTTEASTTTTTETSTSTSSEPSTTIAPKASDTTTTEALLERI